MTWTDGPTEAYDLWNQPTAILPIVPATAPVMSEATMVLPTIPVDGTAGEPTTVLAATPATNALDEQPSVAKSSAIMAAGSMVSRVTGLLRTIAIGAAIGASTVGNAYGLANNLPNMVYELLLGGVLGSVLVPYLTRARLNDKDRGEAFAQRLMTLTLAFLVVATTLAVAAAPLLTKLFAVLQHTGSNTAEVTHLTTVLGYLILPEILFYGFAALAAAILNTRGHFAAPTWTPILNNIVVIATAGVLIGLHVSPDHLTTTEVLVLGIGTTLGIVVQALGLVPALLKVNFRFKARWDFRELGLHELGRASAWMLAYVLSTQLALIVGSIVMYAAAGGTGPSVAIYTAAFLVFVMAYGICAASIIIALMPRMSAAAAEGRLGDLATQMASGTRLSAVILIPITAAYLTLGHPLAITLFNWHSFTHSEAEQTGTVIALAGLGLIPYAISQMQLFGFYALREQKTAGLISFPVAGLRIALYLLFYWLLPTGSVTASLMIANLASYVLASVLGYIVLERKIGRLGLPQMFAALGRLAVAAIVAAIPTYLLVLLLEHTMGTGKGA
ncbi:MAG TPA: murein biosynthesis integral membrane protein MurJ, partial [Micromonosporaceae bacterium]